jgi:hypothetical protein
MHALQIVSVCFATNIKVAGRSSIVRTEEIVTLNKLRRRFSNP